MNERFKELAEQAGFVMWAEEPWKPKGWFVDWSSDYDNELAKFAELIVQECASIVYKTCQDGDAGAQAILYEFDIDNARSQK